MTAHPQTPTPPIAEAVAPQLWLPGQTAAHEGPIDMTMMYLMHHAFRRDLDAFARAVPRTPVEDRRSWRAMADRWQLFSTALHHHHQGEDTWVWPALTARVDGVGGATLEAMKAEHDEIDPMLSAVDAGFARLRDHADLDARAALSVRVAAARESLGRHLRHEETEAIELIQRLLSPQDWEAVETGLEKGTRVSFILRAVPWVMHGVPSEVQQRVVDRSGPVYRLLWWLTRRGFGRREARAFRYLEQ